MFIGKPECKRYYKKLEMTENEFKDLKYILANFIGQIKITGNEHYNGDKIKLMKKIVAEN